MAEQQRRRDEFKGGKRGDAARERRAEQAADLVREKRRQAREDLTEAAMAANVRQYNQAALVERGDVAQLTLLHDILSSATAYQLEKYAPILIMATEADCTNAAPVVGALARFAVANQTSNMALETLHHLVGIRTSFDVAICKAVVDTGLLDRAPPTAPYIWIIALNVSVSCPEARLVVLHTGLVQTHLLPCLKQTPSDLDLQTLLNTIVDAGLSKQTDKMTAEIWAFAVAVWPAVMVAFQALQAIPYAQLSDDDRQLRGNIISTIHLTVAYAPDPVLQHAAPLLAPMIEHMYRKLAALAPALSLMDAQRAMDICNRMTTLPMPVQAIMDLVPTSIDMMLAGMTSTSRVVREKAFMWLGNYMSDSTLYVQKMLDRGGIVDVLLRAIQMGERNYVDVRRAAVWALMTMFARCHLDYRSDIALSADAGVIMRKLVCGCNIFRTIIPFMGTVSQGDVTNNILGILIDALKWNYTATMEALQYTEAEDRLDVILANIKGGAENEDLYNNAMIVDDLIHKRDPDARMRVDVTTLAKEPVIIDGVYHGVYKF